VVKKNYQPNFEWHKGYKWINFGTRDTPVMREVQHKLKEQKCKDTKDGKEDKGYIQKPGMKDGSG
jgi:hypothetical protein